MMYFMCPPFNPFQKLLLLRSDLKQYLLGVTGYPLPGVLIFCFLFLCTALHGQQLRTDLGEVYYEPNFYMTKYSGTEGSPYLNESFAPAKIEGIEKTQLVRFDAVEGQVEVMVSEDQVVVLDGSKNYVITLLDGAKKRYEILEYFTPGGEVGASFFEVLESNDQFSLYLKEEKKFYKKEKAQGYASEKPARFEKIRDAYYVSDFKNPSDRLLPVPGKMKSFLAFFGDHGPEIKKFIREHKLKTDNAADLVRIFGYYFQKDAP